ncbi:hypothetical protein [Roseivivax isoporae]|uniref:Uncharacterized protein n=1 Tax=Roseivivax isoporae LMG 25204 TaxID=1449351 RepID=X7F532_9RHOB|nr:hypothetical protein [Roseivivax isoporae]ETX27201.1 hypothetical protein RISW2_15200 [Roseivivax isoporae LMG 25204]
MTERAAVLTGDIVGSRKAGREAVEASFDTLARSLSRMAPWCGGPARLTRFRGDGWQALVPEGARALRAALVLRADLRAEDRPAMRVAIGLGGATRTGSRDLSDADGPAFHAAGDALDAMGRGTRLVLAARGAPALAPALVTLCDAVSRGWSRAQAEAAALALVPAPPTQAEIAARFGISQQAVAARLDGAGAEALEAALEAFEGAVPGSGT